MSHSLQLSLDDVIAAELDLGAVLDGMPDAFLIKGMFVAKVVALLSKPARRALFEELEAPPLGGRYVPFANYPQRDYMRAIVAAAAFVHPRLPAAEGARRLARDDFEIFGTSVFGRVVLSMVEDVRGALHKTPYVYSKVAPGTWQLAAHDCQPNEVELTIEGYHGLYPYTLGQLEGIVLAFEHTPSVRYVHEPSGTRRFFVSYGAREPL